MIELTTEDLGWFRWFAGRIIGTPISNDKMNANFRKMVEWASHEEISRRLDESVICGTCEHEGALRDFYTGGLTIKCPKCGVTSQFNTGILDL